MNNMDINQIEMLCDEIKHSLEKNHDVDVEVSKLELMPTDYYHVNIYVDGKRISTKMSLSVYNKYNKFEVFIPMEGYFQYDLNVDSDQIVKLFSDKKINNK
jgi:hypothetical protein